MTSPPSLGWYPLHMYGNNKQTNKQTNKGLGIIGKRWEAKLERAKQLDN
jgi:hypothetical protein